MPRYNHNFNMVNSKFEEKDTVYGLKDMHTVRTKVQKIYRDKTKYLTDYILNKYNGLEFWRRKYSVFGV